MNGIKQIITIILKSCDAWNEEKWPTTNKSDPKVKQMPVSELFFAVFGSVES
jgi:hypothetical protein